MRDLRRRACRSRSGEAEGSPIREVPERVGAALTTPGRASIARWGGSGKRDEEEYARNQRDDVPRKVPVGRASNAVCRAGLIVGRSGQGETEPS